MWLVSIPVIFQLCIYLLIKLAELGCLLEVMIIVEY